MLGLDVSKASLVCTLLEPTSRRVAWERRVPNSAAGVDQLLAAAPPTAPWVLEPTGRYSAAVVARARAAGRDVRLAPPRRAKAFLSSIQGRAKTDRLDSRGLALYALAVPLPPYPLKSEAAAHMDQLLAARRLLARQRAALEQQRRELPAVAAVLAAAAAALSAQIAALDGQIAAAARTAPHLAGARQLDAIPGVGPITAAALASRLADRRFTDPDQFVAYVGLDVRVRDSGARRGTRALSRQGDAELRRLLFLFAQASLRPRTSPFRAHYERERAKGLASTAALCAVARKIARTAWSMLAHDTPFDPTRLYRQPPAAPSATLLP